MNRGLRLVAVLLMLILTMRCNTGTATDFQQNGNVDNLFPPIDLKKWKVIPIIRGRIASEKDVAEGRAVFHVNPKGKKHTHHQIHLPFLAYAPEAGSKERVKVVAIQVEDVEGSGIVVGVKYVKGGCGVFLLNELEIIQAP